MSKLNFYVLKHILSAGISFKINLFAFYFFWNLFLSSCLNNLKTLFCFLIENLFNRIGLDGQFLHQRDALEFERIFLASVQLVLCLELFFQRAIQLLQSLDLTAQLEQRLHGVFIRRNRNVTSEIAVQLLFSHRVRFYIE